MKLTVTLVSIAIGACLAGCTKEVPKATDADLERSINARMAAQPELKDISVSANADRNEATLSGTVASEAQRTEAVDLAKAASPGLLVTDKIDVKPRDVARSDYTEDMARQAREKSKELGDKIGKSLDDAWIHTKITAKLLGSSETPARKINVDVMSNIVTLRGQVDTVTAKKEAEKIAKETDGVKRVVNRLVVKAG